MDNENNTENVTELHPEAGVPAQGMTQEEMAELQEKLRRSQQEFDKRNTVNNMTIHMLTAMMNGHVSQCGWYDIAVYNEHEKLAREMAVDIFEKNQANLDEGAALFNEEVE